MIYHNHFQQALENPAQFWLRQAQQLNWFVPPTTGLHPSGEHSAWFADGQLNTCFLALDSHVEQGRADKIALIWDSPVTGQKTQYTYQQLLEQVSRFAGALVLRGIGKGDRVVIYMPMIPQAAIAMLACARLGAIHSVVFGGFAPKELAVRIDDAQPKLVVTASCGIEGERIIPYKPLVDAAINMACHQVESCIVYQREQLQADLQYARDVEWDVLMAEAPETVCTPLMATDPLYILYTSGTTGKPKGVVRDNGGHAVALNYSLGSVYNLRQNDVFWAASDVGWVVGHSYIVYGPLIFGATTVMFEGKPVNTPDAGAFWRVVHEYQVSVLFAAPTAFRAIRKADPQASLILPDALSSLKAIFMAGERLDPTTYAWACQHTGKPVIDHWWQTETGWPICANPLGLGDYKVKPGSSTFAVPGYNLQILDGQGNEVKPGEQGAIAIKLPLPPGCLSTLWQDEERFRQSYLQQYAGYYTSGDGGYIDDEGYVYIMGRTDDVINVAGHRLSTGEMEEVLAAHDAVAECTVIGVDDALKGQVPVGLVLLKDGVTVDEATLQQELIDRVRQQIGPVASFKRAVVVRSLPKTRSGKILRKLIRQIAQNAPLAVPSTIEDPEAVTLVQQAMSENGLLKR